jgi:hypothetical protein
VLASPTAARLMMSCPLASQLSSLTAPGIYHEYTRLLHRVRKLSTEILHHLLQS